jgi:WD40 repeat protein
MISGSSDENVQKWDLQESKEIKEARIVCEEDVNAVAVSWDGRWVITGGGESGRAELKACKIETGIATTFEGHSGPITCVDIALDSTLLVSGSWDATARIWSLKTGKLVAGPFRSVDWVGAIRLSTDSKKLAVKSWTGRWLEIWDVKTGTLAVRVGEYGGPTSTSAPVFWTNKNKNILTTLINSDVTSISEFDASTLKTVGAPFAGHTEAVTGLALSFDGALLASTSSRDNTIKLWAFESRQVLASFDVQKPTCIILSPNSRQLAYTTSSKGDHKIYICNNTPDILARLKPVAETHSKVCVHRRSHIFWALTFSRRLIQPLSVCLKYVTHFLYCATSHESLQSDATRRHRNPATSPAISFPPRLQTPLPATESQQTFLHHLRRILRFSSPTNAVPPIQHRQPRDPLDVCLFILILS